MFGLYNPRRVCLFRHKWAVVRIAKTDFNVTERCSWCDCIRVRGLLPADEEKQLIEAAHARGRTVRLRILNEINYFRSRRAPSTEAQIKELQGELATRQQALVSQLVNERSKKSARDKSKIRQISAEARGLLFGRR